jgi:lipopolysaccharide transport system permease protein
VTAPADIAAYSAPPAGGHLRPERLEPTETAWGDWWAGTRHVDLWGTLAWYDIVLRYRRSLLGPWWITLSMGAMLLGMGPLYAALFGVPLARFYPHLALGIIFWNFLSTAINDGCQAFITAAPYLKQGAVPRSVFVWRSLARQLFFLAHHLVLYLPVAIWAGLTWNPRMLLVFPGLLVVIINLHALSITLGLLSARFRDVPNIVASSLQLLMFLTPVFWFPEKLPERSRFILYNPLAQLLDVLRLPLLGGSPAPGTVRFLLYFTVLNVAVAALLYGRLRRQVVYWV